MLTAREVEVGGEVVDVNVLGLRRTRSWEGDVGRERDVRGVESEAALQTVEHCRGAPEV